MEISYKLQSKPQWGWKLYSFTTENIAGYINQFDFKNKKILTVAGSGDHILNVILKGGTTINAFDINRSALFYCELKLVMLKELELEQFLNFFMIDGKYPLDYDIYTKYADKLTKKAKHYFDELYKRFDYNGLNLRLSDVFDNKYDTTENKLRYNCYLNTIDYELVKNRLNNVNICFIEGNIKDLQFSHDYDTILLSNISDYLYDFGDNRLQNYFNSILKLKTDKNNVVFGYVYDIDSKIKRSEIDYPNFRKKAFSNSKYIYSETVIESAILGKKDCILILKGDKL